MRWVRFLFPLFAASALFADPEAEVRAAVAAWRNAAGYAWESTARATVTHVAGKAAPVARPRVTVRGRSLRDGMTEVQTVPRVRNEVPVTAYIKSSTAAVAGTPVGWMTRQEMRDSPESHPDRTVQIEGKPVRLHRFFAAAIEATRVVTPIEEVLALLGDIGAFEEGEPGEIVGRLKPRAAEMLHGNARSLRPEADFKGSVIFRLRDGLPVDYEIRFESITPATARRPESRAVTSWKITFNEMGTATVELPPEAATRLEELS